MGRTGLAAKLDCWLVAPEVILSLYSWARLYRIIKAEIAETSWIG